MRGRTALIREIANARAAVAVKAEGNNALREATESLMQDLRAVCKDIEAANCNELLKKLPEEVWEKIVGEHVQQNDRLALAMTCRFFREKQKDLGKKVDTKKEKEGRELKTDFKANRLLELRKSGNMLSHSFAWYRWVCDTFEILPGCEWDDERVKGAVYEGNLLNCAAFQGSVDILRRLLEEKGWETNEDTGWLAGMGGSVEVLEYLNFMGYEFDEGACAGAAKGGHLEALRFLRGLDPPCPWDEESCTSAAKGGHLGVLRFLRAQDPPCPWDEKSCSIAACWGHLEVLEWLRAQEPPCPWDVDTCTWAAKQGHLEVLKWSRSQTPPCPWNERTCSQAALGGQLEALQWLRAQDPPCPWEDHMTCIAAVCNGHLDVLEWLRDQNPPCLWIRRECGRMASECGHQHIVDWIDEREDESDDEEFIYSDMESSDSDEDPPHRWDVMTCEEAAREGDLELLEWLRAQNPPCPWDHMTCAGAAEGGHLDVLRWVRAQDPPCPWDAETC